MPATINIWNASNMAANGAQTGGTWTYTGSITPAPTPPPTYNDVADFTGITTVGQYEFTYTTTDGTSTDTSKHTVNYSTSTLRAGDTCATAYPVPSTPSAPFTIELEDYNDGRCPGAAAPTSSGEAIPASWGAGPFNDIWYYISLPSKDTFYLFTASIDGTPYGSDGISNPLIEIWTANAGAGCASKASIVDLNGNGSQYVIQSIGINSNTAKDCWIRVASPAGDEGTFLMTFEAIC